MRDCPRRSRNRESRELKHTDRFGTLLWLGSVALSVLFLWHHRTDLSDAVGGFAAIANAAARIHLAGLADVVASAAGAAIAALVVLAWYGAGDLVLRCSAGRDRGAGDTPSEAAHAIAYGAGVWSLIWFLLGLAGLYAGTSAIVALVIGTILGGLAIVRRRPLGLGTVVAHWRTAAPPGGASVVVAVALLAALVAALAPPTAKDALIYHLALPKTFAAASALVVVPHHIPSYFPLGIEMHGLWAMLVGRVIDTRVGEAAGGATFFAFFPLLLAVVHGWARRVGLQGPWPLAACALVASVPTVYDVAASAYVDLALAVYVALALQAAARWWVVPGPRPLVHIALAMGFALAVKLLALVPFLIVALILLLRVLLDRHRVPVRGPLVAAVLAAVAAAATLGAPWYARTWAATGSPVFPFFMELWPASVDGWDVERSFLWQASIAQYGPPDAVSRMLAPFWVSLTGRREIPELYEGVLGPVFLVGIVLVGLALWRGLLAPELIVAAAAGVAMAAWWAVSAQLLRYMLPALAPLAIAIAGAAAGLAHAGVQRLLRTLMVPTAAGVLVTLAWFVGDAPLLPVAGAEARAEYLSRRLDHYPYYRLVNETLPSDARVWLIDMRRDTYHLDRAYFSDYFFEDHTLRRWAQASDSPAELTARARKAGITHVLVRHDMLLDYARSVLVEDARPREENLARLGLVRSFLVEGTTILRADSKFLLAALPQSR